MSINHRRISFSIAANLFLEIINKISPLLILYHAQMYLGLADFGWAQLQLAVFETLQPFITYGFPNYAMAHAKENDRGELGSLFSHVLVLKLINALLVVLFFIWKQGSQLDPLGAGILFIVVVSCVLDCFWLFVVRHKLVIFSLVSGCLRLASLLLIFTLVRQPEDRHLFVLLSVLPPALMAVMTGLSAFRTLAFSKIFVKRLQDILSQSTPYALLILAITFLDRLDIFLVEHWFGVEAAGAYSGPARVILSLSMLLSSVALPFLAETRKIEDRASLSQHAVLSLWLLSAGVAPIVFGVPFVEEDIIALIFPRQPASTAGLLSVLAVGLVGNIFLSVFGVQLLLAKGRAISVLKAVLMGLVVASLLAFVLKDGRDLQGVALSIVVGKILVGLACLARARVFLLKVPVAPFIKPMLAGAGMGLGLHFLKSEHFVVNIVCGGALFGLLLFLGNHREFMQLYARLKHKLSQRS